MDQLALLLILFFAIAIGFVALYLLLRRASAHHASQSSEQAVAAAVSAALAERGATAEAVGREREATVATAVARAVEVADEKLNARMREGSEQLDARMRAGTEQLDARMRAGTEQLDARFQKGAEKLDANMKLGHQKYDSSASTIEKAHLEMRRELKRMEKMMTDLQEKNAGQHGAVEQQLVEAAKVTAQLQQTTGSLRDALGSSQKRGHWGERMAEDVLRAAGMKKGVNYRVQSGIESGGRPDISFHMPKDMLLHMDVKFPADNFLVFLEAEPGSTDAETARKQFIKDSRNRVKELADRKYHEEQDSVDTVVLFIPNENIFTFIQENAPELMDEAMHKKIVLCGPSTVIAVLQVVRQAIDSFMLERRSNEIMECLVGFKKEWEKFSDQIDKHGKQLNTALNSFNELAGARTNQLGRQVRKIDQLQASPVTMNGAIGVGPGAGVAKPIEAIEAVEVADTEVIDQPELSQSVDHEPAPELEQELWPPLREVSIG